MHEMHLNTVPSLHLSCQFQQLGRTREMWLTDKHLKRLKKLLIYSGSVLLCGLRLLRQKKSMGRRQTFLCWFCKSAASTVCFLRKLRRIEWRPQKGPFSWSLRRYITRCTGACVHSSLTPTLVYELPLGEGGYSHMDAPHETEWCMLIYCIFCICYKPQNTKHTENLVKESSIASSYYYKTQFTVLRLSQRLPSPWKWVLNGVFQRLIGEIRY